MVRTRCLVNIKISLAPNIGRQGTKGTNVEATSKTRIVRSRLALTINWSPGINFTEDTECSWPGNVFTFFHSFCESHILINRSDEHVTVGPVINESQILPVFLLLTQKISLMIKVDILYGFCMTFERAFQFARFPIPYLDGCILA